MPASAALSGISSSKSSSPEHSAGSGLNIDPVISLRNEFEKVLVGVDFAFTEHNLNHLRFC
jgi:hypothetical protein